MDKDVKSLLDGIMTFDNIPRKKPKFVNFVKNVIGGGKRCSPTTIEKVDIFLHRGIKNNILNILAQKAGNLFICNFDFHFRLGVFLNLP